MKSFWWVGIVVYTVWQVVLRWSLDLTDLPGAAGTETIYKASIGQTRGDLAAEIHLQFQQYWQISTLQAAQWVSFLGGLFAVLGATLCGYGVLQQQGAFAAGVLAATWPLTHYYSLLTGADPIAFGVSWFSIGLCWAGFSRFLFCFSPKVLRLGILVGGSPRLFPLFCLFSAGFIFFRSP